MDPNNPNPQQPAAPTAPPQQPATPTPAGTATEQAVTTLAMFGPDGQVHQVPNHLIPEAMKGGGKFAVTLQDKDGNYRYAPHDVAHQYVASGQAKVVPVPATQPNTGNTAAGTIWDNLKTMASEAVHHPLQTASRVAESVMPPSFAMTPRGPVISGPKPGEVVQGMEERRQAGHGIGYQTAAAMGENLGVPVQPMEKAAKEGRTGEVVGHALTVPVAMATTHVAGKAAGVVLGAAADRLGKLRAAPPEVTRAITDAVNPHDMAKFEGDLKQQLPRIADYAQRNGIELSKSGREGLLKAVEGAQEEAGEFYREQMLKPLENELAPNGQRFSDAQAELDKLDKMIDYARANNAATPETQLNWKAQAASLRQTLNEGMGKKLGVTPEQVQEAREASGQLKDMAIKTRVQWEAERAATNNAKRGTVTLHASHSGALPKAPVGGSRIGAAVTEGVNRVMGHPSDKAINKAFSRWQYQHFDNVEPQLQPSHAPTRPMAPQGPAASFRRGLANATGERPAQGATIGVRTTSPGEAQAVTDGIKQRGAQRATDRTFREAQAAETAARKTAGHGYKAAKSALAGADD